jgi:hypothetical protein
MPSTGAESTLPGPLLGRRQRYPAGVLAVVAGVAVDVSGAVGGGVVVTVASGAALTVFGRASSLATVNSCQLLARPKLRVATA